MKFSGTICICGAGTMGRGIAQVSAQSGFPTILYEPNANVLQSAQSGIFNQLDALVQKGKIPVSQRDTVTANLKYTSRLEDCHADFFIEAIIEDAEIKIGLFNSLMAINAPGTIYASNTSSLSLTELSTRLLRPSQLIGLHFFNPAPLMKLVEVVTTKSTSTDVLALTLSLAEQMGKTSVKCKDSPGFIVNRVARPYYIESLRLAEENVCDFETIDKVLESTGFKMGPFRLMDLIGNDVNFAVSNSVYEQLDRPERLRPSAIQKSRVEAGDLGRKSGKGYYDYTNHAK